MMKRTQKLLLFISIMSSGLFSRAWSQQWGDYTLYSVQNTSSTYLIDTNSTVFHTWTHASSAKTGYSSYLMPGGILWRTVANQSNVLNGGGITGRVQKIDYSGTVLWDFTYSSSTYCLHHDICPLPNGNVLLISYDVRTAAEATQAGCSQNTSIQAEKIIEVEPTGATTGNIIWEWKVWDHLVQNYSTSKDNYQTSILDHPELLNINYNTGTDWMHMNGLDYNPVLDQVVFSSHNLNQWFVIDHSTTTAQAAAHSGGNAGKGGDFLYRYGNPASYGASGSTVLNVTHDAHWIPEGSPNAGRLVGFNNKGISNSQSSIDYIIQPQDEYNYTYTAGSAYTPAIYTSRTACNGVSTNMGNSQQMPNGNTLICMATQGVFYEIDPSGAVLWTKTASGTVPQAFRYTVCYVNNAAPAIPTISGTSSVLTASSATTYQWYRNGMLITGATSQAYTPATDGIYVVRITDANGCVPEYSKGYAFTSGSTSGLDEQTLQNGLSVFPNPTAGVFTVNYSGTATYAVTDLYGNTVLRSAEKTIDLSSQSKGIYFLNVLQKGQTIATTKLILVN